MFCFSFVSFTGNISNAIKVKSLILYSNELFCYSIYLHLEQLQKGLGIYCWILKNKEEKPLEPSWSISDFVG
jgi:hypothetical protein